MNPFDIICLLSKGGYSQQKVADQCGVSRFTVNLVIHGHRTSFNVATKVAEITNTPMNRLWPDGRYEEAPKHRAA